MRTTRAVIASVVCLAAFVTGSGAGGQQEPQEENQAEQQEEKQATKPTEAEEKRAAPKKAEPEKHTVQVTVTVEGKSELPSDSRIMLSGRDGCENLQGAESRLRADGKASFPNIPTCTILFRIIIPGFETKFARVDLAKHKGEPIRIQVRAAGPPAVE